VILYSYNPFIERLFVETNQKRRFIQNLKAVFVQKTKQPAADRAASQRKENV
jgi:hypothetical protein